MTHKRERFWAIGLGIFAFAWYLGFASAGLPPEAWGEAVVAADLRAPFSVFPGLARYLSRAIYGAFGIEGATAITGVVGKVLAALSVALVFSLLRYILTCVDTPLEVRTKKRALAGDLCCAVPTVMFAISPTMVEISESLGVESLGLFLSFAALALFFRFVEKGGVFTGGLMLFLFGVVIAETPSGFVFAAFAAVLYKLAVRGMTGFVPRPPSMYMKEILKWWATLAFAIGFFGVIWFNLGMFVELGGLEANDIDMLGAVLNYVTRYGEICVNTATPVGWMLTLVVVVFPLVLTLALMPRSKSEEKFLKWYAGMLYFATGVIAVSQLGGISGLWFRTWTAAPSIHTHYLTALCLFLSAITLTLSLAVMSIEAYFRNHRAIVRVSTEVAEGVCEPGFKGALLSPVAIRRWRMFAAVAMPVALVVFAWPFGNYRVRTTMRGFVDEAVEEIARESGAAKWIFTDGVLDCGIELKAAAKGGRVYPLAMMGDSGAYAKYLRLRGEVAGDDRQSLETSSATTYRDWVLNSPDRTKESSFMLGLEMWRAAAKTEPESSGFLAKVEWDDGREDGIARAKEMAERMIAFCKGTTPGEREAAGSLLNRFFSVVTWRLSRFCAIRQSAWERAGNRALAKEEQTLGERLDETNPYLLDLKTVKAIYESRPRERLTAKERLKVALMRADFTSAAREAKTVLEGEPRNVDALFAIGMKHYFAKEYGKAEVQFQKALDEKPRDGVIWNNLAMCQLEKGELDEAEESALKAVKILTGSTAASNTLVSVRKAKEERR